MIDGYEIVFAGTEIRTLEPTLIECIWIEICAPTCISVLCCVYRPNSDKFLWSVDKVPDISSKFLIGCDLNVDFFENSRLNPV